MRRYIKKWMVFLCVIVLVIATGTMVHAETVSFYITITGTGYNQDNVSKRAEKTGGEDLWFINPSHFSQAGGRADFRSVQVNNTSMASPYYLVTDMDIGEELPLRYQKNVPENVYYFLEAHYRADCPGDVMNVSGTYTP